MIIFFLYPWHYYSANSNRLESIAKAKSTSLPTTLSEAAHLHRPLNQLLFLGASVLPTSAHWQVLG